MKTIGKYSFSYVFLRLWQRETFFPAGFFGNGLYFLSGFAIILNTYYGKGYSTMKFLSLMALEQAAADAVAAEGEVPASMGIVGTLVSLLPMILIFVIFYFMLIRPQRKKEKKVQEMLNALKVGDRVSTIGGIYGTITNIKDDTLELSVGKDNVKLIFARWAIRQVEDVAIENDSEVLN
jgi:preprotein translocase subunit YajC